MKIFLLPANCGRSDRRGAPSFEIDHCLFFFIPFVLCYLYTSIVSWLKEKRNFYFESYNTLYSSVFNLWLRKADDFFSCRPKSMEWGLILSHRIPQRWLVTPEFALKKMMSRITRLGRVLGIDILFEKLVLVGLFCNKKRMRLNESFWNISPLSFPTTTWQDLRPLCSKIVK